ncbi:MAG: VRR-NUC domain-containing protein [Tannerellaceae bacterium]|jgi:hypothetical protein|nr:VRR-NUC domain-containing protein [Tannerellaceae bacterium]
METHIIQTCKQCRKKTVKPIRIKEGEYLCYSCFCDRTNSERIKKRHNDEARIQEEFFSKVKLFFPKLPDYLLFTVPNGGSRNKAEAANLKRQGVKAGVADVILLMPGSGYGSLAIEFKTITGRQSPAQIEFQKQAEKAGNKYVICRSATDAIMAISEYLNINI